MQRTQKTMLFLGLLCSQHMYAFVDQKEAIGLGSLPSSQTGRVNSTISDIGKALSAANILTRLQRVNSSSSIIDASNPEAIQHFPHNISALDAALNAVSDKNFVSESDRLYFCGYLTTYEEIYTALTNSEYIAAIREKLKTAKATEEQLAAFDRVLTSATNIKNTLNALQKKFNLKTTPEKFQIIDPDIRFQVNKYMFSPAAEKPTPAPTTPKPTPPAPVSKPAPSHAEIPGSKTVTLINWSKNYTISVQDASGKWFAIPPRRQQQYVQIMPKGIKLAACSKSATQCDDKKASISVTATDPSASDYTILVLDAGNSFFSGFSAKNTAGLTANILPKAQKSSLSKDIRILPMTPNDPSTTMIGQELAKAAPL